MYPQTDYLGAFSANANGAILFDVNVDNYQSVAVQLLGTFVGTVTYEQTIDGTTWYAVPGAPIAATGTSSIVATSDTAVGLRNFPVYGSRMRGRVSAYTSGTIQARVLGRDIPFSPVLTAYIAGSITQAIEMRASSTAPGSTTTRIVSAASTNLTSLKTSAGNVFDLSLFNTNAALRYFKLYNKTSAPVLASDTPFLVLPLQPGVLTRIAPNVPLRFATGIAYAIVAGLANTDATAVAVDEIQGFINWA